MKIPILDQGYLELVTSWGSDEDIVRAARMSTGGGFNGWGPKCRTCGDAFDAPERDCPNPSPGRPHVDTGRGGHIFDAPGDEKLLSYLWSNKHATPFEMAGLTVEVQAPIMVFREWHRHRTQCLSGDTSITCVSPRGTTFKRSIREIFDLKHGGVVDNMATKHKNGYSRAGSPVLRGARRKSDTRVRILPNCQNRLLRVLDESTREFTTAAMADVWESGVKETFLLKTENEFSVQGSAEHPFYTDRGWVKMKDIQPGDRVARMGNVAANERPIPPALRKGIAIWTSMMRTRLIREEDACYICHDTFPRDRLILDHVIPVRDSLLTALDTRNLKPACEACSVRKTSSEQPCRIGMMRRGIRWEKVIGKPTSAGEAPTYDIEVVGPHHNYLANDIVVHNSYSEASARYGPLPAMDYLPSAERCCLDAGSNRQAAAIKGSAMLTLDSIDEWRRELSELYAHAQRLYEKGLAVGIPKELARLALTVGRYSKMRASANLRNWLGFLTLRMDEKAQFEIRTYANAVGQLIQFRFPRTWQLFSLGRGVA